MVDETKSEGDRATDRLREADVVMEKHLPGFQPALILTDWTLFWGTDDLKGQWSDSGSVTWDIRVVARALCLSQETLIDEVQYVVWRGVQRRRDGLKARCSSIYTVVSKGVCDGAY